MTSKLGFLSDFLKLALKGQIIKSQLLFPKELKRMRILKVGQKKKNNTRTVQMARGTDGM